jgi:hypothetical protein
MCHNLLSRPQWTLVILAAFSLPPALAEEKPDPLAPMDVFNLQFAADPKFRRTGSTSFTRGSSAT